MEFSYQFPIQNLEKWPAIFIHIKKHRYPVGKINYGTNSIGVRHIKAKSLPKTGGLNKIVAE